MDRLTANLRQAIQVAQGEQGPLEALAEVARTEKLAGDAPQPLSKARIAKAKSVGKPAKRKKAKKPKKAPKPSSDRKALR